MEKSTPTISTEIVLDAPPAIEVAVISASRLPAGMEGSMVMQPDLGSTYTNLLFDNQKTSLEVTLVPPLVLRKLSSSMSNLISPVEP